LLIGTTWVEGMPDRSTIVIELERERDHELDRLARLRGKTREDVAREAVLAYLDLARWQVEEIEKGLAEADAGDFSDEAEVEAVLARWTP
jgi:predicted transcriptional regulator